MNQCFPQVSRHFCRDRCWGPGFLCDVCSVCTDFYYYPENGEGAKEVNLWTPALRTCIPYGHLGNSWRTSFHSASLSHPSTLLIEKITFLWTSISKILWNSNFSVFLRTIAQHHSGRATKGKRPYGQARRLTSPDLAILCRIAAWGRSLCYEAAFPPGAIILSEAKDFGTCR